jgi:hypothetical protein
VSDDVRDDTVPASRTAARVYTGVQTAIALGAIVLQLVITWRTAATPRPTAYLRFFSYFTIQSNILLLITSWQLTKDPGRDGRGWRVLRLDALLGITVTGLVYTAVLREPVSGWSAVANAGLHYVGPAAAVVGWLLWGPRPRVEWRTVWWSVVWPLCWLAYTLVHGAISGWYPYPFVDVPTIGYPRMFLNCLFVTILFLAPASLVRWGDRVLPARPLPVPVGRRRVEAPG